MTPDERADRLAATAAQLVARIRDDEPTAVHRWLGYEMAGEDWAALAVVLAAAVPDDRPWLALTAWRWKPLEDTTEAINKRRKVLVDGCRRVARAQAVDKAVA
jgi:hypothetical protein